MSNTEATSSVAGSDVLPVSVSSEVMLVHDTHRLVEKLYTGMLELANEDKPLGGGWRSNTHAPEGSVEMVWGDRRGGNGQTVLALTQIQTSTGPEYYMEKRYVRTGRAKGATPTERNELGYTVTHTTYRYTQDGVSFSSVEYDDSESGGVIYPLNRGQPPQEMVALAIGGIQDAHNDAEQLLYRVEAAGVRQPSGWLARLMGR